MLHLCKLSVGVRDVVQLRARQHGATAPSHQTRNFPRRAAELLAGGSIYWVIGGVMSVRQRIIDISADHWDDGSPCARLVFAPDLVPVIGRRLRPFQGWRYLEPRDAPPDLGTVTDVVGEAALPEAMRRDLRALCLL
jgi:hypothetical protein